MSAVRRSWRQPEVRCGGATVLRADGGSSNRVVGNGRGTKAGSLAGSSTYGTSQADHEVADLEESAEVGETGDFAGHDQRLDLTLEAVALLAAPPLDRLSLRRSISTSPMVSATHFAACASLVRRKIFVAGCDSMVSASRP